MTPPVRTGSTSGSTEILGRERQRSPFTASSGTGVTEVVLQQFSGAEAYLHGTVINGGDNWPTPTTVGNPPVAEHFDATSAIVEFWNANAGLP